MHSWQWPQGYLSHLSPKRELTQERLTGASGGRAAGEHDVFDGRVSLPRGAFRRSPAGTGAGKAFWPASAVGEPWLRAHPACGPPLWSSSQRRSSGITEDAAFLADVPGNAGLYRVQRLVLLDRPLPEPPPERLSASPLPVLSAFVDSHHPAIQKRARFGCLVGDANTSASYSPQCATTRLWLETVARSLRGLRQCHGKPAKMFPGSGPGSLPSDQSSHR